MPRTRCNLLLCAALLLASGCARTGQPAPVADEPPVLDLDRLIAMGEQAERIAAAQVAPSPVVLRQVGTDMQRVEFHFTFDAPRTAIMVTAPSLDAPPEEWTTYLGASPIIGSNRNAIPEVNLRELLVSPLEALKAAGERVHEPAQVWLVLYSSGDDLTWTALATTNKGRVLRVKQ